MHSAVNKRVLLDIKNAITNLMDEYGVYIAPEENNYYNVHFVIQGPEDTPYEGGVYHGMVRLNHEHPNKPPSVFMITPSGRFTPESYPFSPNSNGICTTFTAYHPDTWSPMYTIETVMKSFISFMCDDKDGGMGSIKTTVPQRKKMAIESLNTLINDALVMKLFPDLHEKLSTSSYIPEKIGTRKLKIDKKEIKKGIYNSSSDSSSSENVVVKKKSKKIIRKKKSETSSSEEIILKKRRHRKKKSDTSSSEESSSEKVPKKKRRHKKKSETSSSEESSSEEAPKKRRRHKKKSESNDSSSEEDSPKRRRRHKKKSESDDSSSEEDSPKRRRRYKKKSESDDSSSEESSPKKKSSKRHRRRHN
jgi:ubiquitin-protein ligase